MTDDRRGPATESELSTTLQTLFRQAHENGVTVRGGWPCRNGPAHPDWDVVVTEVEKPEAPE